MSLQSMTGFAREAGTLPDGGAFAWELRSVNSRNLDLRLRLPPGLDGMAAAAREAAGQDFRRGSIQCALSAPRDGRAPVLAPDPAAIERALALALDLAARIPGAAPPRAEAILALPGVLRAEIPEADPVAEEARREALLAGFRRALLALRESRAAEGARLREVLDGLLREVVDLVAAARAAAEGQPAAQRARLQEALDRLLGGDRGRIPEERLAQEVALLASRSDVREELDRLDAHVAAARALVASGAEAGRRLDFLAQEFAREANTLCAKSATAELTRIGLDLKAAIERLKEQAANVE